MRVLFFSALDQDYNDRNRESCANATKPLIEAVDNLCTFANSPEFATVPAKISSDGRGSQEPITSAGKAIIDGSCAMIHAAKSLAVNPKDPPTWQLLANHSKNVSDSIKKLVSSIRYVLCVKVLPIVRLLCFHLLTFDFFLKVVISSLLVVLFILLTLFHWNLTK